MRIEFRKVGKDANFFELKDEKLTFSGSFRRVSNSIVRLDYKLNGELLHSCDACAEDFWLKICEESSLEVSNGRYDGDDIDVVETFDGFINFDEIFQSEVESIKSDYHYCRDCIEYFKE
jgi:hypothetical protein